MNSRSPSHFSLKPLSFSLAYKAWYLRKRRRKRLQQPLPVVKTIPGLQLWLDASAGAFKTWDAVPQFGNGSFNYGAGSEYVASGNTHAVRIFAYKIISGLPVFSLGHLELSLTDDGSFSPYTIEWTWDPVPDATGYRVLKSDPSHGLAFNHSVDVTGTSLLDTDAGVFTGDATVTPNDLSPVGVGDPVYLWQDQSGNQNDASQLTWAKRPSFLPAALNGKPALRFDMVDDGMMTSFGFNSSLTAFIVYAYNDNTSAARRALQGRDDNWLVGPYGLQYAFYTGGWMLAGPATGMGNVVLQTAWQAGSEARNYLNGQFASDFFGGTTAPGAIGLGAEGSFPEPLNGDIAEVIVYSDALSESERQSVESYLIQKYSIL